MVMVRQKVHISRYFDLGFVAMRDDTLPAATRVCYQICCIGCPACPSAIFGAITVAKRWARSRAALGIRIKLTREPTS
jgi:hypothetical protein